MLSLCTAAMLSSAIPGTDPTGRNDSSVALNHFVRALCAQAVPLQDVYLSLEGGVFLMESPLAINASVQGCSGTLHIRDGTLISSPLLARLGSNESFLVAVMGYWTTGGVTLSRLTLACNHSSGGLRVDSAGHVHLLDSKVLNFRTYGVLGSQYLSGSGHDLVIERCLLTECTLAMSECADIDAKRGTGLLLAFSDSHVRNSVFTCSRAGIINRGGSNTFTDLHIWTSCTGLADYSTNTTIGFAEEGGATRISNCQLDNSRLVISQFRGTAIAGSVFQGTGRLELAWTPPAQPPPPVNHSSPICEYWRGALCGLQVTSNDFICTTATTCASIDVSALLPLPAARWVHVEGNAFENDDASLCSARSRCESTEACATLFVSGAAACDAHDSGANPAKHRHVSARMERAPF